MPKFTVLLFPFRTVEKLQTNRNYATGYWQNSIYSRVHILKFTRTESTISVKSWHIEKILTVAPIYNFLQLKGSLLSKNSHKNDLVQRIESYQSHNNKIFWLCILFHITQKTTDSNNDSKLVLRWSLPQNKNGKVALITKALFAVKWIPSDLAVARI